MGGGVRGWLEERRREAEGRAWWIRGTTARSRGARAADSTSSGAKQRRSRGGSESGGAMQPRALGGRRRRGSGSESGNPDSWYHEGSNDWENSRLIMEVHNTHTYIGKGLGLVYRNTTNQGVPCPLHKKPRGGAVAEQARHTTNPKGLMGLYISSLTETTWYVPKIVRVSLLFVRPSFIHNCLDRFWCKWVNDQWEQNLPLLHDRVLKCPERVQNL
jgi:hypothetical protein